MHINAPSQGWQALCFEFSLFLFSLWHSGRHRLTNSCPSTSSWHSHEFECHVFFSGRLVSCLHTLAPCIYLQILNKAIWLFLSPPPVLSIPLLFLLLISYSTLLCSVFLPLYLSNSALPSLFPNAALHPKPPHLCFPATVQTWTPGTDARAHPFCDHLGGDRHLPGVSSHLHLHFLLPAWTADRPQHHP